MNIKNRFTEPQGWQWDKITPRDGQYLRYGWYAPEGAKALCVIFPGLSEYGEKYFEVARDLAGRSFATAVIDWRGQGRSWHHLPDTDKRHHDSFDIDVEDAKAYLAALDSNPKLEMLPKIVLGHSMGGHIAMRTMHDLTDVFQCAVLTAPMFGILPTITQGPARMTAEAACRMGWSENFVPGYAPWSRARFAANLNLLTSDRARRDIMLAHMDDEELRMGGITFGWVRAALATTRLTHDPAWLAEIRTPTLLFSASREMIVSTAAIKQGAKHMPNAELVELKGCLHEILMEQDTHRNAFWGVFDGFVAKHLHPR